jgi:carboxyl-terminal processing protease
MKPTSRVLYLFILLSIIGSNTVNAQLFNEESLKIFKLFNWIESYYVDSVNFDKLSEEVMRGMLQKLDPHSAYISKNEVEEMNEPLQGNFEGIGITFNILNDTIFVVSPVVGGPSEKIGIRAGDRIISIDNENVTGKTISNKKVFSKLRGKKGTKVSVVVKRHAVNQLLSFTIVRDKIPLQSVDAAYKINSNTEYIRLSRFSSTSLTEIDDVLATFQDNKVKNLILDLSGNGGGYLDVAVELADDFLDAKKLIVYTKGIHSEKKEYISTSKGLFEKGKLVLIIDEGTASASEILAGAVQDWDRGLIVGRRSFGKGLVQRPFTFPDGAMVRLTIARYYTPSGRLIQKPYMDNYESYSNELSARYKSGELLDKNKIILPDSLKHYTLVKNRPVYGGGGITPDVFVPLDTTSNTAFYRTLISKSILNSFTLEYTDEKREKILGRYPDFDKFKSDFLVDNQLMTEFIKFAADQSVTCSDIELSQSKPQITLLLKAYIARDLWGQSEFFEIYNSSNPACKKAIEVINNWETYFDKK